MLCWALLYKYKRIKTLESFMCNLNFTPHKRGKWQSIKTLQMISMIDIWNMLHLLTCGNPILCISDASERSWSCLWYKHKQYHHYRWHYTDSSNSLIDLFPVSSTCSIYTSGVRDPFLDQHIRFHCPLFYYVIALNL